MNHYVSTVLDERFSEWKSGTITPQTNKSAIDLIISDYISTHKDKTEAKLDPKFKAWAIVQLRLMFFVARCLINAKMETHLSTRRKIAGVGG